ncbi:hypothetical protein D3C86_1176480 [compost metagenome]
MVSAREGRAPHRGERLDDAAAGGLGLCDQALGLVPWCQRAEAQGGFDGKQEKVATAGLGMKLPVAQGGLPGLALRDQQGRFARRRDKQQVGHPCLHGESACGFQVLRRTIETPLRERDLSARQGRARDGPLRAQRVGPMQGRQDVGGRPLRGSQREACRPRFEEQGHFELVDAVVAAQGEAALCRFQGAEGIAQGEVQGGEARVGDDGEVLAL